MVAEGLAVGRERDHGVGVAVAEDTEHAVGEEISVPQPLAEREAAGPLVVAEHDVDGAAARQAAGVHAPDVERRRRHVVPLRGSAAERPYPARLVRRQHRHRDALGGERFQRRQVDGHLGEPHAFGRTPEAERERARAPAHLRADVARRAQREDRMVVGLRPGVAVAGAGDARAVRRDQVVDQRRRVLAEPRVQRRADVEARPRIVVDDAAEPAARVEQARGGVRRVALAQDARIPIVVRCRRGLRLDHAEPGMLTRWLVVVAVNADGADAGGHDPSSARSPIVRQPDALRRRGRRRARRRAVARRARSRRAARARRAARGAAPPARRSSCRRRRCGRSSRCRLAERRR